MPLSLKIFVRTADKTNFLGERVLEGERVTVGRSKECTLSLDDPDRHLSRVHAELVKTAQGYLLKAASKNYPVIVNGQEYLPGSEVMVRAGDSLAMDVYELEIVSTGDADVDPEATMVRGASLRPPAAVKAPVVTPIAAPAAPPRREPPSADTGQPASPAAGRGKWLIIGGVAIAVVVALVLLLPTLKGLMPESEGDKKAAQKIARLDGEARSLLKLVETDRRDLKEAVAAANREIENVEGKLRAARTGPERATLDAALREARHSAKLSALLENKLRIQTEGPNGQPKAEGSLNAAAAAVKAKDKAEAVRLLEDAVASLTLTRSTIAEDRKAAQAEQALRKEEVQIAETRAMAVGEVRGKAEAEAKARADVVARAKAEADKAKAEALAQAKTEAEAKIKAETEARAKAAIAAKSKAQATAAAPAPAAAPAAAAAPAVPPAAQAASGSCLAKLTGSWTHPVGGTWNFFGNKGKLIVNSSNYGPRAQQITDLEVSSCENDTMTYKIVRAQLKNTADPGTAYDKTPDNTPTLPTWRKVHTQPYSISANGLKFGDHTYAKR